MRGVASQGKTVVYVIIDGAVEGAIALADIIRPESREALERLKAMGIQVMMLTGDAEAVARWVSEELGLDDYFAEVLPDLTPDPGDFLPSATLPYTFEFRVKLCGTASAAYE